MAAERLWWALLLMICLAALAACGGAVAPTAGAVEAPTVSRHFGAATMQTPLATVEVASAAPTVAHYFRLETATPRPTSTRRPTVTPRPTRTPLVDDALDEESAALPAGLREMLIYGDELALGWSLEHSAGVSFDLADERYAYSGAHGAAITPLQEFGRFFLTVREDADASFPYERVVGVRFWLNGGPAEILSSDLALTIVGSDALTHYDPADESVTMGEEEVFSETRLYDLGVNRTIPPETWVEISVRLDDLLYDPDYTFVTGLYIKNDTEFLQTYYIDDVALMLVGE